MRVPTVVMEKTVDFFDLSNHLESVCPGMRDYLERLLDGRMNNDTYVSFWIDKPKDYEMVKAPNCSEEYKEKRKYPTLLFEWFINNGFEDGDTVLFHISW